MSKTRQIANIVSSGTESINDMAR